MVAIDFNNFRTFFAQFIASWAKNCILFISGLVISIPTIAIPALTSSDSDLNFTYYEASWFASMIPLFLVIGTVLSGCTAAYMGRKRSMLASIVPHIFGMALLYFAKNVPMAFVGASIMGFAMGLGESAISTYVSEISQPKYRGMLLAISSIMVQVGTLFVFAMGFLLPWRTVLLVVLIMPCIAILIISFVPEAPMWLLSKNRKEDAQAALQWLRGWVAPEHVKVELEELQHQVDISAQCFKCETAKTPCTHKTQTVCNKVQEIFNRPNRSVFHVVLMLFFISYLTGAFPMRPFIIQILEAFGVSIDANLATISIGVASVIGKILSVVAIKLFGKRKVGMLALFGTFVSVLGLGIYAKLRLPANWISFKKIADIEIESSHIPLILFTLYYFCHNFGVESMPFIALCEMFPFRNRCACTSLAIAIGQLMNFITTKCYIYLELGFALSGTMWFFAAVSLLGIILIFFLMPESEGVSLKDIEHFFSDENRKITDVNMKKFLKKSHEIKNSKDTLETSHL